MAFFILKKISGAATKNATFKLCNQTLILVHEVSTYTHSFLRRRALKKFTKKFMDRRTDRRTKGRTDRHAKHCISSHRFAKNDLSDLVTSHCFWFSDLVTSHFTHFTEV